MSHIPEQLRGLYVISDDTLTPNETIIEQITEALQGGATIVQLRNKKGTLEEIKSLSITIQELCHKHNALFILNDKIDLAIELGVDGLHIGKSDHHRFEEIRKEFKGVLGVSCYNSIDMAKDFERLGADYAAFGSFFHSATKPNSNVIEMNILKTAQEELNIPVCAIGGINLENVDQILEYKPQMVSVINDIWTAKDIQEKAQNYTNHLEGKNMKLSIALEWFLNPDHLPIVAGIQTGKYKDVGLDIDLIEPEEHYDGFDLLEKGQIDIHINEPLHLFEHHFDGIKSLGCYFETHGGVMIRQSSVEKLRNNEPIRITTPASNPITNTIGFEILKRYADKEGFALEKENVDFIETDFYHIKNMKEQDFDGAWLCFYNFEGIEAEHEGFENLFVDQRISPYPNFSALELMTSEETLNEKREAIDKFIAVTNEMTRYCQKNSEFAKTVFYDYSKQEKSELMDKIIDDTLERFEYLKSDATRWRELADFLDELDIVKLDNTAYDKIW
ncbi:MAG: Unknown protein [uncultured Sulfurovum sp.]|uniref:Thiamine-phosphate synthase n=1 Tax=uncultured Sulfurovum sp. TaxID=269237 RepID=A0A6S6SNX3_9BACT|nr:MAG: Unknown protein [uncultured Sulfurovum sp.]